MWDSAFYFGAGGTTTIIGGDLTANIDNELSASIDLFQSLGADITQALSAFIDSPVLVGNITMELTANVCDDSNG